MCGIFGIVLGRDCKLSSGEVAHAARGLFRLSESRGKEASGLALVGSSDVRILKRAIPPSRLMRTTECNELLHSFAASVNGSRAEGPGTLIGHSRLVTDGGRDVHSNNQPVVAGGMVGVHNGIVVNVDALWAENPSLERKYEVDSEVIFELIRMHHAESGSLRAAVKSTYDRLRGTAAIAAVFSDRIQLLLATNNGSLYTAHSRAAGAFLFASETWFLRRLAAQRRLRPYLEGEPITAVEPGTGVLVDLHSLAAQSFDFAEPADLEIAPSVAARRILDLGEGAGRTRPRPTADHDAIVAEVERRHPFDEYPLQGMLRCSRCILPATIPFITFDEAGVCNFCHGYEKLEFLGQDALLEIADRHRGAGGAPDSVVAVSGGRDSTYALHYVRNVLNMNPVAFTYDWGMVTPLARRNIARICGQLGVEHILVSADIPRKRRYIRRNVLAWLERPDLGLIPLFMAGDKAYFYNAYKLRKKTGLDFLLMGENMLERDFFKACFAGAPPEMTSEDHIGHLTWKGNLKMILFYLRNYLANPGFLNSSIPDTIFAYLCYFVIPRDYHNLFRFIPWDEKEVISTLIDEYDWETAPDTTQTWRIGDGTSPFYNFIYYNVAGFSENDNFYSNQIREGTISRSEALANVAEMNRPRFASIKWYCDTIGIDFAETVDRIAAIPKLYDKES